MAGRRRIGSARTTAIVVMIALLATVVPIGLYFVGNVYFGDNAVSAGWTTQGGGGAASSRPSSVGQALAAPVAPPKPAAGSGRMMDLLVVDQATHQPILGLTVEVTERNGWTGMTGADGHAHVPLPAQDHPDDFNVRVRGRNYVAKRLYWGTDTPALNDGVFPPTYTMEMEHGVRVSGKLVDAAGHGMGGDLIGLNFTKNFSNPHELIAAIVGSIGYSRIRTDSQGNWSFNGAPSNCDEIRIVVRDSQRRNVQEMQSFTPVAKLYDGSAVITVSGANAGSVAR